VIAKPNGSTGRRLFDAAVEGAGVALASKTGLSPGAPADIVALDATNAFYLFEDRLIDNWIFGGDVRVDTVWAQGKKKVVGGRHVARDRIRNCFAAAMHDLMKQ